MPRIPDELLTCVVYLYPDIESAKEGDKLGGSGFVIGVKSEATDTISYTYVVTNSHVIEHFDNPVVRVNIFENEMQYLVSRKDQWKEHSTDDIVILPIKIEDYQNLGFLQFNESLDESIIEKFNIGPGDDTYMIGRFINHEGKERNLPSVRFGNISMMPIEPVLHRGRPQDFFLVEVRSIPGYSGSPVFVHIMPFVPRPKGAIPANQYKAWLMGIDCGVLPPDTNSNQRITSMMCVIPIWKLRDILFSEEVIEIRRKADKRDGLSTGNEEI